MSPPTHSLTICLSQQNTKLEKGHNSHKMPILRKGIKLVDFFSKVDDENEFRFNDMSTHEGH